MGRRKEKLNILIICRENSCRSQMAEGILKSRFPKMTIISAGIEPAKVVNPLAVQVVSELGIDISKYSPKSIESIPDIEFDLVFTVCDSLKNCIVFSGETKHLVHIPFPDPSKVNGSNTELQNNFRAVRDEIKIILIDIISLYLKYKTVYYRCPICNLHFDDLANAKLCEDWCLNHPQKKNLKIVSQSLEAKTQFKLF